MKSHEVRRLLKISPGTLQTLKSSGTIPYTNRIGFDKRTVSDSNNYQKIAKYCRKMELKYELKQVLSPRLYLSQKERLIPRQDIRKERLKEHIKQSLAESKIYADLEKLMKEKKYTIIKGRGISFIDDKKVKIKGSEVDYSLQTIEHILEKQSVLSIAQSTEMEKSSHLNINHYQQLKKSMQKKIIFYLQATSLRRLRK